MLGVTYTIEGDCKSVRKRVNLPRITKRRLNRLNVIGRLIYYNNN